MITRVYGGVIYSFDSNKDAEKASAIYRNRRELCAGKQIVTTDEVQTLFVKANIEYIEGNIL